MFYGCIVSHSYILFYGCIVSHSYIVFYGYIVPAMLIMFLCVFRFKEMQMQAIIREIIFYLVWLYILMMVAYGNRDPWSYMMTENFNNMFVHGSYAEAGVDKYNMRNVSRIPPFSMCSVLL